MVVSLQSSALHRVCSVKSFKWHLQRWLSGPCTSGPFSRLMDHIILCRRLSSWYGIKRLALQWFTSYLCNCSQCVKTNDTLSAAQALQFGVPQFSVLGPVLFTMYTAPLSRLITGFSSISHHLYADETQVYASLKPGNSASCLFVLRSCVQITLEVPCFIASQIITLVTCQV